MAADDPVEAAVSALRNGGIIAYPTEGVWGLGCDPFDEAATLRLLALKQREVDKGLILIAASPGQLDGLVDWDALPASRRTAVLATWPGPQTWVVPATEHVPAWISGGRDSVAVRVTAHADVVALCNAYGGALVSTSANVSTQPAPRVRAELDPRIIEGVDAVLDGETSGLAQATSIRDARDDQTIRT
ncbi:tRNA threonylcarbamoyladenosine biosynthesis protein RimN [Luteimonas aestuarii]|uniref:Threonylcarbamoyl-AMP synthase n=1 Tax=Luteimonas aestuarii TaxID=453837 RepID=A0A4R5U0T1_9GAMM|nr:Sua5/YciO/YrdC/YwlC family protein [Luteimonas aestuarii]TDK27198.1 tRNA threonylcarbamoyladenosine biosynthesis protein RimN [Luteimonas aestuarii]